MTYLSHGADIDGYTVLEFPRGPRIGKVKCVGTRRWVATCDTCETQPVGRTRPEAAHRLATHARRTHLAQR